MKPIGAYGGWNWKKTTKKNFKICDKRFWDLNKDDESSDDDFDVGSFKKRKGPRINVVKKKKWEY